MKLLVVLIFSLLLLSKCAPSLPAQKLVNKDPRNEYPELVFGPDLWQEVEETFRPEDKRTISHNCLDSLYVSPTSANLEQIEKHRQKFRLIYQFRYESWDCDDFAREATYFAKRWGHLNYVGMKGAVAWGSVYVRLVGKYPMSKHVSGLDCSPSRPGYHVLNIFRRNDGVWFFFEPQNGNVERADSVMFEGVLEVLRVEI